ncbi:MAG: asparagine synthase (glutamine-hydrolyzing) [Polyangiaceae bacterium]|nr:asparagine synthase (glutamine-hydrolyzing) [Polyangiaceae bacterium]
MCGFVAILRAAGLQDHERDRTLARMTSAVAHRGPDEASTEIVDGFAALGHRRLSIIDLEGASQPLRDEAGSIVCVFNGEIYNFKELRARLVGLGHRFLTHGDGEVIVQGYKRWGEGVTAMLEGMFAFALVDRARGRVLAARDRFGIKPLFWAEVPGAVLLGSEIKALLEHPGVPRVASGPAIDLGLARMHAPWPLTAFDGVRRLPPGASLTLSRADGTPSISRFARMISAPPEAPGGAPGGRDLLDRAEEELERAVARQMVADVPVGAFLSGGIDSTLVVAMMRRVAGRPFHTFSIGVDRAADDESAIARETARRLGTTHHELRMDELRFEDLEELPALYDEPFAETSALGVRALSRAARERVKVVLTGDGGDEVFGGYDTYRWIGVTDAARRLLPPAVADRITQGALDLLERGAPSERARRALRFAGLVGMEPLPAHLSLSTLAWAGGAAAIDPNARFSAAAIARAAGALDPWDAPRRALACDRIERLPNAMLTKVDVASMSASIEVRVPLLDDALVRFADSVPTRELIGLRRGKLLLRRLLERLLPGGPAWARKRGFSLPIDAWVLRHADAMRDLFEEHRRPLAAITGVDAARALADLRTGSARFSPATAAMRLLYLATVAWWAARHRVTERSDAPVPERLFV